MKKIIFIGFIVIGSIFVIGGLFLEYYYQIKIDQAKTPNGQMIIARETAFSQPHGTNFIVSKYPPEAVSWSLRLECSTDRIASMQALATNKATTIGEPVNCNKDIELNKEPYPQGAKSVYFLLSASDFKTDQVVNIVSKTFDSAGVLLNQSSLPITIQVNADYIIKDIV